ncbi:MAG: DUF4384 domain-containing protein [Anaerolineae bacterium]|jgi:hypothetical protein
MRDDEFKKAMDAWAESEIESAPDLRPTTEMIRLVQARQEPRRALPVSSRWALAGAAAAALLLIAVLFASMLRSGLIPGYLPTVEGTLIAQRQGPAAVQTVIVTGGKGDGRGQAAFRQLVFEIQQQDSPTVQAVDLLNPPREPLVLTPADNYRLLLEPVEAQHVYVYQRTAAGNLVQLFPNPAYSPVPNPIPPGQLTVLPAEPNWLYLDGVPGEERLYLVASPQPLHDLDDLYTRYRQAPDAAGKAELLSELLGMLDSLVETQPDGAGAVEFAFQHR